MAKAEGGQRREPVASAGLSSLPRCQRIPHGQPPLPSHWPTSPSPPARSSYLADAFQSHLQSNELLHEVFRFSPAEEPEERLTPLEKRLFRSKSSTDVRDRTEQRRRARATMANYKHGSLAEYA